jgi:hypothetical protein
MLDLMRAWNAMRCEPSLDDGEVIATVNSIAERELRRRGRGDAARRRNRRAGGGASPR